jgi:putative transposase
VRGGHIVGTTKIKTYYHVWFVTKYRKAVLVGDIEKKVKEYLIEVAEHKNYNILAMEANIDHVHILAEVENRRVLANMVRILKCVSAKKILEETPHLRAGNVRHFWTRGYGHKLVYEPQLEMIKEYIRKQKEIPHT